MKPLTLTEAHEPRKTIVLYPRRTLSPDVGQRFATVWPRVPVHSVWRLV